MTRDRSAQPHGKRIDVDLPEGVVLPARWSRVTVVLLVWTSWEPWGSICGADFQKIARKTREEVEGGSKKAFEGKTIGHAGIYRAQNIRRFTAVKSIYVVA